MPNRLAGSTSPYLLQHADNPVDWYPWGAEAFDAAARRDVPILLSIGYAACHWCHVMAHESFEDPATAEEMNAAFVNVKVDREERPDVDRIYMDAVQAMTGRGGWPMTVFLTPAGEPFYAGTYFPKDDRPGYPSFRRLLAGISDAWSTRRTELTDQAARLTAAVRRVLPPAPVDAIDDHIAAAVADLESRFDEHNGGFGRAPKFPQAPSLELLARVEAFSPGGPAGAMLETTLDAMAAGGIHDLVGGGFARYSVDAMWLVPHFEKMLYDNALLARVYLRASQVLGTSRHGTVATRTLEYLRRDLRSPEGAFYSSEDADSEGIEGKFYVWAWSELLEVLGGDEELARLLGASPAGNFEGASILHLPGGMSTLETPGLEAVLADLDAARSTRVRPPLDDKVVAAWNGFAIRAFAEAGAVLGDDGFIEVAETAARFVLENMRPGGRLARAWRDGATSGPAFADDHASLAVAALTLYQVTGNGDWAEEGLRLVDDLDRLFADPDGGYRATGIDAETLIDRPINLMDNPTPSDNALAAEALVMAAGLTGDTSHLDRAAATIDRAGALVTHHPGAVGHLLAVAATIPRLAEVAIVGSSPGHLVDVLWERFRPECVVAIGDGASTAVPLLVDRPDREEETVAYVCQGFVCDAPVSSAQALREALR